MQDNILFTILIPTRNRLSLLKHAVNSVIKQNYENWELIVTDNNSDEDVCGWLEEIGDSRIRFKRQENVISVTDNWNDANAMARGDYIIMLGDDDALVPNALNVLNKAITDYNSPALIAYYAYIFLQPNVDPSNPQGCIYRVHPFERDENSDYLSMGYRKQLVVDCCQFKTRFGHNMQYYCYSRKLCDEVCRHGKFYEPPYPDYYTSCMMLLCADKAVLIPDRVTIIGVTSKSYGFYYHNNNEKEGMKFHKESDYRNKAPLQIREKLCSVDEMDTAAAATYALLCERCGKEYEINIKNYYKAVIERELLSRSKDAVINIAAEEMKKNVSKMDYTELLEYIHGYFREERRTIDQRQLPWDNVTDLLNDISFVENTEKLEDIDLEYWLSHTNINICGHDKGVFIWGAYSRGKRIKDVLSSKGILVKGYIDNKDVKEYDGLPVFKLKNVNPNRYPIVLSMRFIYEDVIKELRDCGYGSEDGWVFKQILK